MTIKLVVAPSGSGKTEFSTHKIYHLKNKDPFLPIYIVVPDGYSAYKFRQKIASKSGLLGIKIGTFFSLSKEILESNNYFYPIINKPQKNKLIDQAIKNCVNEGKISHYSKIINFTGFREEINNSIQILKRSHIYPEIFLNYVRNSDNELYEYAQIYNEYQKLLNLYSLADIEGINWLTGDFINRNPSWNPDFPQVIFDGFDSFTQSQLEIISQLNNRIENIIITLPGDLSTNRSVFNRFKDSKEKISSLSEVEIISLEQFSLPNNSMNHINKFFGDTENKPIDGDKYICLIESKSHSDEIREALRWIKKRVIEDDISLNKSALILPEKSLYAPYIELIAEEYNLPLNFKNPKRLSKTPFFENIITLLTIPIVNYDRRTLLDSLQSSYFDFSSFGFDQFSSLNLDKISLQHQIIQDKDIWLESITLQEIKTKKSNTIHEEGAVLQLPIGEEARDLKESLISFFELFNIKDEKRSLAKWFKWLDSILRVLEVKKKLSLKDDWIAYEEFQHLKNEIQNAESIFGIREYTYAEFIKYLEIEASQTKVIQDDSFNNKGLTVLSPQASRGLRFDAVAVVGLSEGIFPKKQKEDPFLNEKVRKDLGIDSAIDNYQWSLCYQVFTRSDKYLLLTRPFIYKDGTPWEPSPFWDNITKLFTNKPIRYSDNLNRNINEAASIQELLSWTTNLEALPDAIRVIITGDIDHVKQGRETLEKRLDKNDSSSFKYIKDQITKKIDTKEAWSASRLESYHQCPYKYYVSEVLEIEDKKEPELGIDVLLLGNIYHEILEKVFIGTDQTTSLEELFDALEKISPEVFNKKVSEEGFRPSILWEIEKKEILEKLKLTIEALHKESQQWKPIGLERAFGINDQPYLQFDLDQRKIKLRGLIDRVDQNEKGDLRIIDYKAGSSHMSKKDLENGTRLQLPIYGLAAQQALKLGDVKEGFYWQVNQAKKSSLTLGDYGFDKAVNVAKENINHAVEGVYQSDFKISPPYDGCPSYCPAKDWCWHFKQKETFK